MLLPIAISALTSGTGYSFIKGCQYLCTRPDLNGRVATTFENIRCTCSTFRDDMASFIGEYTWAYCSNIVFDNAWISLFVINLLITTGVMVLEQPLVLTYSLCFLFFSIYMSPFSYLSREGLAWLLTDSAPNIAWWVSPQNSIHSDAIRANLAALEEARCLLEASIRALEMIPTDIRENEAYTNNESFRKLVALFYRLRDRSSALLPNEAFIHLKEIFQARDHENVRRGFRRIAALVHPDKVSHLSEETKRYFTELFAFLNHCNGLSQRA